MFVTDSAWGKMWQPGVLRVPATVLWVLTDRALQTIRVRDLATITKIPLAVLEGFVACACKVQAAVFKRRRSSALCVGAETWWLRCFMDQKKLVLLFRRPYHLSVAGSVDQ